MTELYHLNQQVCVFTLKYNQNRFKKKDKEGCNNYQCISTGKIEQILYIDNEETEQQTNCSHEKRVRLSRVMMGMANIFKHHKKTDDQKLPNSVKKKQVSLAISKRLEILFKAIISRSLIYV